MHIAHKVSEAHAVALLAEGVDRNRLVMMTVPLVKVALLAEGVDRNQLPESNQGKDRVALLAEGVDRNSIVPILMGSATMSPSSRRAWIEICDFCCHVWQPQVALLAEGVDRNPSEPLSLDLSVCRPPRGGRG